MKLSTCCLGLALILSAAHSSDAGIPAQMMARTEEKILHKNPDISRETLSVERLVVEKAFNSAQPRLKRNGISDKEIADIVMAAWFTKRTSSSVKLSEEMILGEVRKHGLLVVDSTPAGASVTIDRQKARDTECEKWVLSGVHHITIRKAGFVPEEANLNVPPETRVVFKKELRPLSNTSSTKSN